MMYRLRARDLTAVLHALALQYMLATVEILGAKDQLSLALAGSTNDDWLARDHDVDAPVYLFVYPSHTSTDPHRSRWSIAWPVGGLTEASMTAWRHIHADAYDNEAGLETDPPRYVYGGAITKTAGPGTLLGRSASCSRP
ncbi:hypothetical protein ONZ51_g7663 [Trametes cubensis]|uniref:Uncharacterized protein n=1 Tax=Trametes cubensis TaxID=1111947 RepID=A0AAD7X785_9APHY|nr:hypothetical protein ONZ51_g7663 [Trametes cubensis]